MSVSVFLDTLKKHELDQFYPTFSTHGITHLQSLAQLSLQDYSRLGITDTVDRRKIFGLVQAIRKETDSTTKAAMSPSLSTLNSGLRQPQTYPNTRLPQPDNFSSTNRSRRQSVIGSNLKSPQISTERPTRTRTMSDAPRPDFSTPKPTFTKDRRLGLRRSLYLDQLPTQSDGEDDEEEDEQDAKRKFRVSAPLLDAYGVPMSPAKAQRGTGLMGTRYDLPLSDLNQKIRVCVRKRPLSKKEIEKGDRDMAPTLGTRSLQINEPKLRLDLTKYTEQHTFTFDDVFDLNCSNALVYERTALPLVNYIFKGGKATCFAYGQTGSGKTYTMLDPINGLYILAARDIFTLLRKPENQHLTAWIGLYEIYQGQLYDLLNERKKLFAREDGKNNVIISGLREYPIDNVDKLIQVFEYGSSVRSTGSTGANDSSSRSHAVLQILLKYKTNKKKIHGKMSFIDLAGSERGADRGEADTKTRMEGAEINKSLLALKECIRALDQDKRHTPFRQSKLTQVLKDSFVGNSRTCMIATISPGGTNSEHTLNTLRYADRVKELKGERDRRIQMERNTSNSSSGAPEELYQHQPQPSDEDPDEDEAFIQNDSNDDEYFSNESDILDDDTFNADQENIFDVDFPHEQDALIYSNFNSNSMNISSPKITSSPRFTHTSTLSAASSPEDSVFHGNKLQQRPNSMSPYSNVEATASSSSNRPLSLQMKRSSSTIPRSFSLYTPQRTTLDDLPHVRPLQHQPQQHSAMTIDTANLPQYLQARNAEPSMASPLSGVPSFGYEQMDEFVKFHRAEIREITDCTKKETKLVANISLDLSSNQESGQQKSVRSSSQFQKYLRDLDEVLERKLAAVEALRDRINETVCQIEL